MSGRVSNLRPAQPGNGLALRHGAHAALRLAPRAEEIAADLRDRVPAGTEADEVSIRLLATVLARIEAAHAWLDERGIFKDAKGEPQPILKALSTWENTAARLADRLGLTPAGRAALGVDLVKAETVRLTLTRLVSLAEEES